MTDSVSIKSDNLDDIKFDLNEIAKDLLSYNEIPDDKIKHILLYSKMIELNNKLIKFNGVLDEFLEIIHKIEKHMFENDQKKGCANFLIFTIFGNSSIFFKTKILIFSRLSALLKFYKFFDYCIIKAILVCILFVYQSQLLLLN